MKILRKGDDFKKLPENSVQEILVIKNLINQGWNYCPKQVYKDFFRSEVKESKVKEVKNSETDNSKTKKETKKETKKVTKKRFEKR